MNIHSRARLTPLGRADLVDAMRDPAWSRDQAGSLTVSVRTAYKWQARFRSEGWDGPVPHRQPVRRALLAAGGTRAPTPASRPGPVFPSSKYECRSTEPSASEDRDSRN